jgi:hypothetical protein
MILLDIDKLAAGPHNQASQYLKWGDCNKNNLVILLGSEVGSQIVVASDVRVRQGLAGAGSSIQCDVTDKDNMAWIVHESRTSHVRWAPMFCYLCFRFE